MEVVVSDPSALSQLTPLQQEVVIATAVAYLLDPENLAAEWLPMLADQPTDPVIRPEPGDELPVKDALTAATAPEPAGATAYTVHVSTNERT